MFHAIDTKTWPRAEVFYYFSQMAPTGYSLTTEADVTEVLRVCRAKGFRFFPAYLWLVTRNLNRQTEFKCAVKDGVLGYYDGLTPLYAAWHEDTKTFSLAWTPYREDFRAFHADYLEGQKQYAGLHGILGRPGLPPENAYTVSAVPWVSFSHFAVHSYENKPYYFPSVEAGKYREENGRTLLPLSLTCHHAATDGWHIAQFLEDLQHDITDFDVLTGEDHGSVRDR